MRRLALAILLALATAAPVAAQSPSPESWRPDQPDRLRVLDTALAPMLGQVQPLVLAVQDDFNTIGAFFQFSTIDGTTKDMQKRMDAARRLAADLDAIMQLAKDGLAVLDTASTEPCMDDYVATTRTGFLALGDSVDSMRVGALEDANHDLGTALYLLGEYGDLIHGQAVRDCGSGAII